jgi:hypothetical protein
MADKQGLKVRWSPQERDKGPIGVIEAEQGFLGEMICFNSSTGL